MNRQLETLWCWVSVRHQRTRNRSNKWAAKSHPPFGTVCLPSIRAAQTHKLEEILHRKVGVADRPGCKFCSSRNWNSKPFEMLCVTNKNNLWGSNIALFEG